MSLPSDYMLWPGIGEPIPPEDVQPNVLPPPSGWQAALQAGLVGMAGVPYVPGRNQGENFLQGLLRGAGSSVAGRAQAREAYNKGKVAEAERENEKRQTAWREARRVWLEEMRYAQRRTAERKEKEAEEKAEASRYVATPEMKPHLPRSYKVGDVIPKEMHNAIMLRLISQTFEKPNKPEEVKRPPMTPDQWASAAGSPLAERARYWEGKRSEKSNFMPTKDALMAPDSALAYRTWQVAAEDYGRKIGRAITIDELDSIGSEIGRLNLPSWAIARLKAQAKDRAMELASGR